MRKPSISTRLARKGQSTVELMNYLPIILILILVVVNAGLGIQSQLNAQAFNYSFCVFGARLVQPSVGLGSQNAVTEVSDRAKVYGDSVYSKNWGEGNADPIDLSIPVQCGTYLVGGWNWGAISQLGGSRFVRSHATILRPPFISYYTP